MHGLLVLTGLIPNTICDGVIFSDFTRDLSQTFNYDLTSYVKSQNTLFKFNI